MGTVAIIGAGVMGETLLSGLLRSGRPADELLVAERRTDRAAELSEKHVRVLPTRSQQAGLAVAVAIEPGRDAEANAASMEEELAQLRTGAVARAVGTSDHAPVTAAFA